MVIYFKFLEEKLCVVVHAVFPALGNLRQEGRKFMASSDCIARPYIKTSKKGPCGEKFEVFDTNK